ncbi:MAG: calcium/sodium antiporter [archaeon]
MNLFKQWWTYAIILGLFAFLLPKSQFSVPVLILLFSFGLIILVKGADYLVDGSSSIAAHYRVSPLVIGLTIVAFGTSVPELTVSVISAIKGAVAVSLGNIVGSNIANIALILGLSATVCALVVRSPTIKFEAPFVVFSGLVLILLSLNLGFDASAEKFILGRIDGIIFLAFFAFFMYKIVTRAMKQRAEKKFDTPPDYGLPKSIIMTVVGIAGVVWGADMLVDSASEIAVMLGVSEAIIGLTIVSIGTSLPELITSVVAAAKKKMEIAVGNVLGSNVFNTFWVLGLVSTIRPLEVEPSLVFIDMPVMIGISVLLWLFMRSNSKITKREGIMFLALYAGYIISLVFRSFF